MSRSYKKFPGDKNNGNSMSWAKRQANKRVRRYTRTLSDGSSYKNLYCRYDIWDWNFRYYSRADVYNSIKRWHRDQSWRNKSLEEELSQAYRNWIK